MRGGSLSEDQPGLPFGNLQLALESGNVAQAAQAIAAGSSVEAINRYGLRPIHIAAANGNGPLIRLLMESGASFTACTDDGDTVFEFLIASAMPPELLRDTLRLVPNLDFRKARNATGATALHLAAARRLPEMCQILLDAGHDPNQEDYSKKTPLHAVALDRDERLDFTRTTIEVLLRRGADLARRADQGRTPFEQACAGAPGSVVEDFIAAAGGIPEGQERAGMELAARFDNVEAAAALLQRGVWPAGAWDIATEHAATGVLDLFRGHFHARELDRTVAQAPGAGKPRI